MATYDSMTGMWWLFWPGLAFLITAAAGLVLRTVLLAAARRWAQPGSALAALAESIRVPSVLWALVIGLWAALEVSELERRFAHLLSLLLQSGVIISITITAAGILEAIIRRGGERQALGAAVTGLGQTVTRAVVLVVGALVLLSSLGIQITPILTALGVGGLAVALALQNTLSNLFAGMHLLADRPIRVGDYVKIADSVEGFVVDVGWRSTRVRALANNLVVVPNKKVAESVITNYDMPESRLSLLVNISVSYGSDPDRVERVLVEEALRAVGEVPGLLAEPAPFVRFIPGFGAYSLDFTLICQVATFVDQFLAQHELRKRILQRFRAEGIEIPFPTHVHLDVSGDARPLPDRAEQGEGGHHRQS
ncbi:MAG TPA: mechanosensitive ion channel family protein [Methylomirabilota bacterium]